MRVPNKPHRCCTSPVRSTGRPHLVHISPRYFPNRPVEPARGRVALGPREYPFLLALAAIAIYGCVPETGQMPTIGMLVAGLFVIEVVTRLPSAPVVSLTATLIVLWSGLHGATGRGSAIVGAWFAFWPIVLVTLAALLLGPLRAPVRWTIGLIGGVAAVAVARTGGIEPTVAPALVAVVVAAPVSLLAAWVVVTISCRYPVSANRR